MTVGLVGLLVVTDAASQAGDRGNEARLRHPRLVSAGLGRHVADLIDLALFCRVVEDRPQAEGSNSTTPFASWDRVVQHSNSSVRNVGMGQERHF